jgi:hypothetical protein
MLRPSARSYLITYTTAFYVWTFMREVCVPYSGSGC